MTDILLAIVLVESFWLASIYTKMLCDRIDRVRLEREREPGQVVDMHAWRAKPSPYCVDEIELRLLRNLATGSVIRNGPGPEPTFFKKVGPDEWMPCNKHGRVNYSLSVFDPIGAGPFASDHIHADIVVVREGISEEEE